MITIKDVAKHAGVSIATISRVLNGSDRVSDETRKRVLKSIRELGYRPRYNYSANGSLLRTIGVLMPDLGGYHYSEILSGIEEFAYQNSFDVMVSLTRGFPDREKKHLNEYFNRKVDGLIICTLKSEDSALEKFLQSGVPVVLVDSDVNELRVDSVNIDNFSAAYHVMKYLYEKHHKKILYVPGPKNVYASIERERGIEKFVMSHSDVEVFISNIRGFQPETGYSVVKKYLKKHGKDFSAIFCVNDYTVLGVLTALCEEGLKVPDDVSVVGFDDAPHAPYLLPPLTTVSQPRWEMGRMATSILIDKLNNPKKNVVRNIILPAHIIERNSTKSMDQI
ncbi:LacI family DNA-binding transcriptional regulator [Thermotoga profunda]|uniref:LacI family DNA-binding transcriptional regulator n=1 Tax=Thermotoga profunda TaxID=1508420 RepID=UPI000596BC0B|nr:LacI family DNA-binding transcriptional regulator [Thermotoga profunda]